jgi:preprotein translocase subunit SecB
MSETTEPTVPAGQAMPPLVVNVQYIKDLSFEVPNAPEIYATLRSQPAVQINLDVQARALQEGQNVFEVVLAVKAEARETAGNGAQNGASPPAEGRPVFIAELQYAGVFTLNGVPQDAVEPLLLIECPRLLFPFARSILSDVTREGGFPPVLLQPIDFVGLWQSRRAAGNAPQVAAPN